MAADDPEKRARLTERIAGVRARFLAGLPDRSAALAALALKTESPDGSERASAFDELRLGLHNLAGSAPTLGLSELGRRAAVVEARVIAARQDGRPLSQDTAEDLASDIEELATLADPA